jgi:hypothetical protein
MRRLGFTHVRSFVTPLTIGLFGSGCDEYLTAGTLMASACSATRDPDF